jgi:hypothetical protein
MKQLITYQFPTIQAMWAFKHEIHTNFYEMDARKRVLTCECTNDQMDLAIIKYNGHIIKLMKETA